MRSRGRFALVLHTHLPWVAHAGAWPVGEEWFHQAFTGSWRRVVEVLDGLARDGHRDVLTLGVTPVLAAMLDDGYMLRELHTWIGNWQLRAVEAAGRLPALAAYEYRAATAALADVEARWLRGGSGVLRPLFDAGVVELLGGPATHPFQPTLPARVQRFALAAGLDDAALRFGRRPAGIWAPECAFSSGLIESYVDAGVERFVVDGPALGGDTGLARPVGSVLAFGRDLEVSYRVWSPSAGYPRDGAYRDFHTYDHASGFRPSRVTDVTVPPPSKAPWDPVAASVVVDRHADDFVAAVVERLADRELVVAAFDTELFGHWWYEGPQWLDAVLRRLPAAGVTLTTLGGAASAGLVGPPVELPDSSWGAGKDWHVWTGSQVGDLAGSIARVAGRLVDVVDKHRTAFRDPVLDQLAREALLAAASDWAFMVTHASAASYARSRADVHTGRFDALADLVTSGRDARALAAEFRAVDGPFGHLDARQL